MKDSVTHSVGLDDLLRAGVIASADAHFGRFCAAREGQTPGPGDEGTFIVALLAALASRALRDGHACLPLASVAEAQVLDAEGALLGFHPPLRALEEAIFDSPAVMRAEAVRPEGELSTPLVIDEANRLYLARYFRHERRLAHILSELLESSGETFASDSAWLEARLDHYFGSSAGDGKEPVDWQREAARVAVTRRFSVITGGPGTGKTSTVVKILALLGDMAEKRDELQPTVQLLAPTGKAAARMMEAIHGASSSLDLTPERKKTLVSGASTIHRALGVIPNNPNRFRRGPAHPLRADVVIVDEASMIDLALMRHLVEALREGARLILLGDRHQLASVEAGSVLAELCGALTDRGGATVELMKSYRFSAESGIFALAAAMRDGNGEQCLAVASSGMEDIRWSEAGSKPDEDAALRALVVARYGKALKAGSAEGALRALSDFRVLCAHRRGPHGVESMNETIRAWLVDAGVVPRSSRSNRHDRATTPESSFYRGRPILVTENDYAMGLHNGDVGLVWPDESGKLAVLIIDESGESRWLSPAQLPAHETAFALTIHKSQGSEYDEVAVLLPEANSRLLSRELVYTGITRARRGLHLFGSREALLMASSRSVERHSGLAAALGARSTA